MNDSELEQTITNRLRARIEADQIAAKSPERGRLNSDEPQPGPDPQIATTIDRSEVASAQPLASTPAAPAPFGSTLHEAPRKREEVVNVASGSRRLELLGEELAGRFAELKSNSNILSAQLKESLANLANRGVPVPFAVQNAVAAGHREFIKLRRDLLAKLAPLHSGSIDAQNLLGLDDLDDLITRVSGESAATFQADQPVPAIKVNVETPRPAPRQQPAEAPALPSPPPSTSFLSSLDALSAISEPVGFEQVVPNPLNSAGLPNRPTEQPAKPLSDITEPTAASGPSPAKVDTDDILDKAEETIERILKIKLKPGNSLPEWDQAVAETLALKRKVLTDTESALSPETIQLANGQHPLALLHELIEQTGNLDDMLWAEIYAKVEAGLGKPIAMAVARHRFTLED